MSSRKSSWPRKSSGKATYKRPRVKREKDVTLDGAPSSIVKRNKIGKGYAVYKAPYQSPLPQQWFGVFRTKAMAVIGTAGFTAGGVFKAALAANSTFNLLNSILSTTGVTITDGGAAARYPIGLSTLLPTAATTAYLQYQVLAVRVKINLMPTLTSDQCMVAIGPATTGIASFDMAQCLSAPFFKNRISTLYVGNSQHATNESPNTLTNYTSFANLLGVAQREFNSDPAENWSGLHGGVPTNIINYIIYLQTMDGLVTTNPIPFEIEVDQTVRLYGLDNGLLA